MTTKLANDGDGGVWFHVVVGPGVREQKACPVAHLSLDTGALKTTEGKAEVPSLDKEGWLRPLRKCREASLAGADGVVGSSHRLSEVERTTPAAPPKERDHLLDGAATPPLPRRGLRLPLVSHTPVSSGRLVGNDQVVKRGPGSGVRDQRTTLTLPGCLARLTRWNAHWMALAERQRSTSVSGMQPSSINPAVRLAEDPNADAN